MKILIIEDEIITATDLKKALENKGHEVLPLCKNYEEVVDTLRKHTPDLILADIRLRNSAKDGIEIAAEITEKLPVPIVYLTSHSDQETFARAKKTFPAAYLFKPFRKNEVVFQIDLAFEHYAVNKTSNPEPTLSENVFFPYNRGHQKVHKQSVVFIKAEGAYVNIFTTENPSPIMLSMNLGYIVQFFPSPNFYKLGRSYLINLDRVHRFDTDYIYFDGSTERVPIPQAKKQEFLRLFALAKTPS
jgi:DNA-binding LytR/AlgR family response regulator